MTYWYNGKRYVRLKFDSSSLRNLVDREFIVTIIFNQKKGVSVNRLKNDLSEAA